MKTFLLLTSILLPVLSPSSSVTAYPLSVTETAEGTAEPEVGTESSPPPDSPFLDEDVTPIERHTEVKERPGGQVAQEVVPAPEMQAGRHAIAFGKSILFFLVAIFVTFAFQVTFIEPKMRKMEKQIERGKLADVDTWDHIAAQHPVLNGISWITYALSVVSVINMIYRGFRTLFQVYFDLVNNPLAFIVNEGIKL
ncbi:hypothetical protein Emag_002744 [Eimeria magna]